MQTATPETRSKPEIRSTISVRNLFLAVMGPTTVVSKAKSVARTSYVLIKRALHRAGIAVIHSGTTVRIYAPVSSSINVFGITGDLLDTA